MGPKGVEKAVLGLYFLLFLPIAGHLQKVVATGDPLPRHVPRARCAPPSRRWGIAGG